MTELPTPAQCIEKYLQLRETKKAIVQEHKEQLLQYDNALEALELHFLRIMAERGETQIKTDKGTAFKTPQTFVKLVDRQRLVDYVRQSNNFDFFTNAVSKETVVAFVEANKQAPPGVEITTITACNVRKA